MTLDYAPERQAAPTVIADVMQRLGVRMSFAKGEEIFGQDEEADLIHMVVRGAARTTRFLSDGRRQIGNFYYPGDLIGLETGPVHRFCAEALSDCIVLVVKRSALHAFAGDGQLDRAVWEATRRELERTQEHLLVLGRKTACEKVASFLLSYNEKLTQESAGGHCMHLPMTRTEIADFLGLTTETVSRVLTGLAREKIITVGLSHSVRLLNVDLLQHFSGN